jgi:hypothetical protein
MKTIIMPRGAGKTTKAIEIAAEGFLYMVVRDRREVQRVAAIARERGLDIPFPLTFDEFLGRQFHGRGIRGFVIDGADALLARLASGVPVAAVTMDAEEAPEETRENHGEGATS